MDPFARIPAELRLQIFSLLQSKATISSLTQASPIMLEQYLGCKSTITRKLLKRNFDDKMIQDAMGIILFPSLRGSRRSRRMVCAHLHSWKLRELPNPLVTYDVLLMAQLDKLHSLLMVFVEDYITKATATFPPREYICLPQPSHSQSYLVFKGQKVAKRFDSCHLEETERKRFLKAFLRVELSSLVYKAISFSYASRTLFRELARKLRKRHIETFRCVWGYASSLYGAIFAHCADAWLPAVDAPPETGLLFPDNFFSDPIQYGKDVGITSQEGRSTINDMACYGFSLIFTMIRFAIARPQNTKALEDFAKRLCSFTMDPTMNIDRFFLREPIWTSVYSSFLYRKDDNKLSWWRCLDMELPSYYDNKQMEIFQQRAWPFFNDERYYSKGRAPRPLFPNNTEISMMKRERLDNIAKSLCGPGPLTKALVESTVGDCRRSQKWQDKMKKKQGNVSETESSSSIISIVNHEVSLPAIEDREKLLTWSSGGVVEWDVLKEAYVLTKT
ncbi:hypothetical protein FGADI_10123 [Fusarium gaditjirri]|uniref:Uncharacterized protein n=1 Tax=Fusarium gaditjirri TaxID=282569 RepID=A0A8H4SY51_9HYPO|nr:hypothetical protein FGADI_10123 [Fusarium gaditjirri]